MRTAPAILGAAAAAAAAAACGGGGPGDTAPFTVSGRARLEGRVARPDGRPLDSVVVGVRTSPGAPGLSGYGQPTDAAGRFVVDLREEGRPVRRSVDTLDAYAVAFTLAPKYPPRADRTALAVDSVPVRLVVTPPDQPPSAVRVALTLDVP